MEIIAAIDLKGNKCVRLFQGDYKQETIFSEDPVGVALHWQALGATRLHLVDLEGAAEGRLCHSAMIRDIVQAVEIPVQVGGGIRQLETMKKLLESGVQRVILGTIAVENPGLVRDACRQFGAAVIVGIDARDGYVCTQGWLKKTAVTSTDLAHEMAGIGVRRLIYTDISRDGTLTQPNFEAISDLISRTKMPIIASGGIGTVDHIKILSQLGAEGVIVGRALYTGAVKLEEALAVLALTENN